MSKLIIEPKKGFGDIKFGTEIEKIIENLGEPEDVDNFENDADINAVLLHYWQNGYSLFFQGDTKHVLAGIETDHPEAVLYGKKVIGISENDVVELMKANGHEDFDRETDEDEVRLSYEEEMVDFYIKDNKVVFVNWDILVDDEGNIME
jgi:hypothetical protein